MAKTRGEMAPIERSPEMLEVVIEGFFPCHDPSAWPCFVGPPLGTVAGDERRFTDEELQDMEKFLRFQIRTEFRIWH